jgi:hypothetical protein
MQDVLKLAKAADAEGHSASAFELFKRVVVLDDTKDSTKYRVAINLLEAGRLSDAESFFNRIRWNAAPNSWLIELYFGAITSCPIQTKRSRKTF